MILLVNQHTVPVFTDVANAFVTSGEETKLFVGDIEKGSAPVNSSIKLINSIAYNRRSTLTRFLSWSFFSLHYFFYLLFCKKPSRILVVTNPPTAPFVTALVASLRNIPFHIVVFDLYPEALEQAGMSSEKSWLFKRWQSNNRWTFKKAKGLITLSESMKQAVTPYTTADKVQIIFNWADTEYIRPIERQQNPFAVKHGLLDKFVVLYSGNMGLTHDLESLIEAAAILRDRKEIVFCLVGEGGKKSRLKSIATNHKLTNVLFLPYQDAVNFPLAMASADIGIVTLGTGGEGISVPSKTYVNMAAGLCIIAISPAKSELNRIVETFSLGHAVLPNQPVQLAEYIRALASSPEELGQFKLHSRQASFKFTPANAKQYVATVYPTHP
jgi:glycosyltransferase involved in cell wall biosynthesis